MRTIIGFKLRKPQIKIFSWISKQHRPSPKNYNRLNLTQIEKLCCWDRFKTKAKRFCSIGLGSDRIGEKPVPKGHLAVYVGEKINSGEFSRVVVPVIYFNHPLFAQLLREAAEEFGYQHPRGITIPCQVSEFEKVQTTIAAGRSCRRLLTWR